MAAWQHNPIAQAVRAPAAASDPACYAWKKDRTQHVVYRGADGHIHELWYRMGQGWKYGGSLTALANAPAAAGSPDGYAWEGDNTQHVIYRGADGQIHELWQRQGQGWKYGGALNAHAGAPPSAGDPAGYVWEMDKTQHILYQGADQQVHELWQRLGDNWKHGHAINQQVRAPAASGNPAGFAWDEDHTQHILYRGVDSQIHELWQRLGEGWHYDGPLSQRLNAPAASSDPTGYRWVKDRSQHILYRGADSQIHELWFREGQGWKDGGALTSAAGGPPAQGSPAGFDWEGDETQHVVYRGQDNQIHELWQHLGDRWKYGGALNVNTGSPAAAGDPDGFAWEEDKTVHIVYHGSDNGIHELWLRK